jgi:hypothetical protein
VIVREGAEQAEALKLAVMGRRPGCEVNHSFNDVLGDNVIEELEREFVSLRQRTTELRSFL